MALDVNAVINLLNLITKLEPIAFDLVAKLVTSLQGKTAEEVEAMNDALFDKIDATADAELGKLPPTP